MTFRALHLNPNPLNPQPAQNKSRSKRTELQECMMIGTAGFTAMQMIMELEAGAVLSRTTYSAHVRMYAVCGVMRHRQYAIWIVGIRLCYDFTILDHRIVGYV